jgi:hypothetical protein
MQFQGPITYQLYLGDSSGHRVITSKIFNNEEVKKFKAPITLVKKPKIYIIKSEQQIVYVGYTSQSVANRLRNGLKKAGTFKDY